MRCVILSVSPASQPYNLSMKTLLASEKYVNEEDEKNRKKRGFSNVTLWAPIAKSISSRGPSEGIALLYVDILPLSCMYLVPWWNCSYFSRPNSSIVRKMSGWVLAPHNENTKKRMRTLAKVQCRHLISALNAWAPRAYTSPKTRLPPSFLRMEARMTSHLSVALIRKLGRSLMCLAYFLTFHSWMFGQPGKGRCRNCRLVQELNADAGIVDWCRN